MASVSPVRGQTSLCNTEEGFLLTHLNQLEMKYLLYVSHQVPLMVSDEKGVSRGQQQTVVELLPFP